MGPFRLTPAMPPGAYQTYEIHAPTDRLVVAACEQVGCPSWRYGWETHVDTSTDLGQQQAAYIRTRSGRTFREQRTEAGITVFRFEAGQRCFAEHRTRPEIYTRTPGDWRMTTGTTYQHSGPADWVEDFGEHQQRLADQIEKG